MKKRKTSAIGGKSAFCCSPPNPGVLHPRLTFYKKTPNRLAFLNEQPYFNIDTLNAIRMNVDRVITLPLDVFMDTAAGVILFIKGWPAERGEEAYKAA